MEMNSERTEFNSRNDNDATTEQAPLGTSDQTVLVHNEFSKGDIPTFYKTIPTLQEMSSVKVAIALWKRVISLPSNATFSRVGEIDFQEAKKSILELPVPGLIREIIENHFGSLTREMDSCLFHFYKFEWSLPSGEHKRSVGDLLFCCWLPNGKIDYKSSALKILTNPKLTQAHKFEIMCRYCLEDEIKKLSIESLPSCLTLNTNFDTNPLVYYWLCYLRGDLDKIPVTNGESIPSLMITQKTVDTWSAIEYFWDRLIVQEQTPKIDELLREKPQFQRNLINKISEAQKFHLFSRIPVLIMGNFWYQQGQEHFAVSVWIYIRTFVNNQQFKRVMYMLFEKVNDVPFKFLLDIWNYCPRRLKKLAFDPYVVNNLVHFSMCTFVCRDSNADFLLAYLSEASVEFRKNLLLEEAEIMALLDASITDQLVKLCLPDASDVVTFKKRVFDSDFQLLIGQLYSLTSGGEFDKLSRFLDYYCPDLNSKDEFCRRLFEGFIETYSNACSIKKWVNIMKFIHENHLFTSPDRSLRFIKIIMRSLADDITKNHPRDKEILRMMEIVGQILGAEELEEFKRRSLITIRTCNFWPTLRTFFTSGFVSWCYNSDDRRVQGYKTTLSINDIFNREWNVFRSLHDMRWRQDRLDPEIVSKKLETLSDCLLWYFEDVEEVKRFKLEKLFEYCDEGCLLVVQSSKTDTSIEVFMANVLPWFFENDRGAIERFKEIYKYQDIVLINSFIIH